MELIKEIKEARPTPWHIKDILKDKYKGKDIVDFDGFDSLIFEYKMNVPWQIRVRSNLACIKFTHYILITYRSTNWHDLKFLIMTHMPPHHWIIGRSKRYHITTFTEKYITDNSYEGTN